jgi:predicted component of type VI protein secretion system
MRPLIIFSVLGAGVLILAGSFVLSTKPRTCEHSVIATPNASAPTRTAQPSKLTTLSKTTALTETQTALAEIDSAMLQVDERTLPTLCAKLTAFEPEVRKAAVSNLVFLADKNAIPALSEAANRITDPDEKTNILKAIEFLQLPTYDELVANGTMKPLGKVPVSSDRKRAESEPAATRPATHTTTQ